MRVMGLRRFFGPVLASWCVLAGVFCLVAVPAQGALTHRLLSRISEIPATGPKGEPVSAPGAVAQPAFMTVASGKLWLDEFSSSGYRVDAFDASSGAFVAQLPQQGAPLSYMDNGVAVGTSTGETEVYVGADTTGPEGAVAVFGPSGERQGIVTGAETPQGTFGCFDCETLHGDVAVDGDATGGLGDWAAGDVYVAAERENVVDVFKPEAHGVLKYAGVQLTGPCATPTACPAGERFTAPHGVAVDPASGVVLVLSGREIDVFRPVEPMVGVHGYELVRRITGTPSGSFASDEVGLTGVAAGGGEGDGDIYVVAAGSSVVDQFNGEGVFLGQLTGIAEGEPFPSAYSVAVDASSEAGDPAKGDVYVGVNGGVDVFGPNLVVPDVFTEPATAVQAHGATLDGRVRLDGEGAAKCQFLWGTSKSLGEPPAPCEPEEVTGEETEVHATLHNLQPDTTYYYLLRATNGNGTNQGEIREFTTAGPRIASEFVADVTDDSATLQATVVPHNGAASASSGAAEQFFFQYTIAGAGTEGCAPEPGANPCQTAPASPVVLPGETETGVEVSEPAQGLTSSRTYHYRLLVVSELAGLREVFAGPDQTFTTRGSGEFLLPDDRQWQMVSPPEKQGAQIYPIGEEAPIQAAADGHAVTYFTTTPTEREPAGAPPILQVFSSRGPTGWSTRDLTLPHSTPTRISVGTEQEYRLFSQDLSVAAVQPWGPFIPCKDADGAPQPCLSGAASGQTAFLQDTETGVFTPLATSCPLVGSCPRAVEEDADTPPGTVTFGGEEQCTPGEPCGTQFVYASPDFEHVLVNYDGLSEWSAAAPAGERLRPVGLLPPNAQGEVLPVPSPILATTSLATGIFRRSVSTDGSRVVWSEGNRLYLRVNATQPQSPVSGGKCAVPADACTVQVNSGLEAAGETAFQTASSDDSRLFFTVTMSGASDLYMYEVGQSAPVLLASGVLGDVIEASEDGSSIYFVSSSVLAGALPSPRGETPQAGQPNLYVVAGGVPRLVAVLSSADGGDWQSALPKLTARVSPDGRWLAFMSQRGLTGYDNRDAVSGKPDEEVYLYHAPEDLASQAGTLVCASCNPTGQRPRGVEYGREGSEALTNMPLAGGDRVWPGSTWIAGNVPGWSAPLSAYGKALWQSRYLSDSGRLFFNSTDALVAKDVNGAVDVYEYEPAGVGPAGARCGPGAAGGGEVFEPEREAGGGVVEPAGCVALISSGSSPEESAFLEASEAGSDVFFLTTAQLSRQDTDRALDVYDAHECTGESPCLPPVGAQPAACETEASCKAAPAQQPVVFGAPASATFNGPGDVVSQPVAPPAPRKAGKKAGRRAVCVRAGKRRVRGRCVRVKRARSARRAGPARSDRRGA